MKNPIMQEGVRTKSDLLLVISLQFAIVTITIITVSLFVG